MAMTSAQAIIRDLLVLACLSGLGFLAARLIIPDGWWAEALALAFPLGAGGLAWLTFMLSLLGLRISVLSVLGSWALVSLLLVSALWLRGIPIRPSARHRRTAVASRLRDLSGLALAVTGVLFIGSLVLSVGRSQAGWDAMAIWSSKGYGIALEGSIQAARHWGEHALSYPLNIPLLISYFALFDGDALPGSKLIFPLFYASLLAGCYLFWRRRQLSPRLASLGTLTLATVPVVYDHATLGYANLPEACYLVLGLLYLLEASLERRKPALLAGGILLGLAIWTRPEGVILVLVGLVALVFTLGRPRAEGIQSGVWAIPGAFIGGSWLIFAAKFAGASQYGSAVGAALESWANGDFHLIAVRQIGVFVVRHAMDPTIWGVTAPLIFVFMWIGRHRLSRQSRSGVIPALVMGAATGVAVLTFYYLASFSGPPLDWWLSTGLDRTAIPSVCLLAVGAFLAVAGEPRSA